MAALLEPGVVISGKYVVERVLGQGGMGVVYGARHRALGERVALKTVHPTIASKTDVERLRREARATAQIKSEHVVRVLDIGALEDGTPFIVMEYVEGITLAERKKRQPPISFQTAVDIVLQICEGAAAAHAAGVVHRDLKPSNVILAQLPHGELSVKVLDFGVAMMLKLDVETITRAATALGSPRYMSPEQLRDAHKVDARSDVWSIGVILYELLSGGHPFEADSIAGVLASIAVDPPKLLASRGLKLPTALVSAVDACLAKDRRERTASVAVLAEAIEPYGTQISRGAAARVRACLGGDRSSLRPGEPTYEEGSFGTLPGLENRIAPRVAIGAAAGVVVLLAWLGWSALQREPPPPRGLAPPAMSPPAPATSLPLVEPVVSVSSAPPSAEPSKPKPPPPKPGPGAPAVVQPDFGTRH